MSTDLDDGYDSFVELPSGRSCPHSGRFLAEQRWLITFKVYSMIQEVDRPCWGILMGLAYFKFVLIMMVERVRLKPLRMYVCIINNDGYCPSFLFFFFPKPSSPQAGWLIPTFALFYIYIGLTTLINLIYQHGNTTHGNTKIEKQNAHQLFL